MVQFHMLQLSGQKLHFQHVKTKQNHVSKWNALILFLSMAIFLKALNGLLCSPKHDYKNSTYFSNFSLFSQKDKNRINNVIVNILSNPQPNGECWIHLNNLTK